VTCAAQFTPSSYQRLAKCLGASVLPWVNETQPSMARGTALHVFLERVALGQSREAALGMVPPEWAYDAEAIDLSCLPDLTKGLPEVGMAWNPSTGACRVLGHGMTREEARAACGPSEIPMVSDWIATDASGGILVDWKSGKTDQLAPAAENWQLLTYAATALVAYGWSSVRALLCRIDQHPPQWDEVVIDALEADAILATVKDEILDAAAKAQEEHARTGRYPPLNVGAWCAWCPSRRACPAQLSTLVALVEQWPDMQRREYVLTPEAAGAAYVKLSALHKAVGAALDDLRSIARQEPLPLPDGTTYSPQERPRLDPDKAHEVLAQRYGQEVADKAVPLVRHASLTEASREVARALVAERMKQHERGAIPKPTLKACEKEARALLEAHGALTTGREFPAGEDA
jgi:hypothetical protein